MAKRTKGWLDDAHINELLAHATPAEGLAICLYADAGCRLREGLRFDPSSLSGNLLRIWGSKSQRWRSVPIPQRLQRAIAAATLDQEVVGRKRLFPFSARQLQRRILELCAISDAPITTPHRLRHSYATRLHAEGIPLSTISHFLGHRNIATTLKYLHVGEDDYVRAAAALDRRSARSKPRR